MKWKPIWGGEPVARPYTEARKKANAKWDAEHLDRISIVMPKGKKEVIKQHIAETGETINAFVNRAIDEALQNNHAPDVNETGE